jgi:hypothetical protein
MVSAGRDQRWSVIPGVFLAEDDTKSHAFVQVLDGYRGHATYHEYPVDAFWADPYEFDVRVWNNSFSATGMSLDIDDSTRRVSGTVSHHGNIPLVRSIVQPGIMGPFAYIPAMECYHGIVSLDHELLGSIEIDGRRVDFSGGRGYIEKDWGTNFPSGYVWMQSNHFSTPGTSLSASVAHIPLWGLNFPGFIVALWHQGRHYRWATYNRSRTARLHITDTHVEWTLAGRRFCLSLTAERIAGGLLKAPVRTEMHKRVDETMRSTVRVRLTDHKQTVIFDDIGDCTALEVHGALEKLVTE